MADDPQNGSIARRKLAAYKKQLDEAVSQYCERLLEACEKEYTEYSREVAEAYCSILSRGGKRMRGALVMCVYEMLGGTDARLSLQAALVIEMIHAYLLITDDICDRSRMRRGGPAAHIMLATLHREHNLYGDSEHFGVAQALNASLLGAHLAQLELTKLSIDDTTKLELLHDLNGALVTTIHGQFNDIFNEAVRTVSEQQVRNVLIWKTAFYSFLNPMQVGATLGKMDPADLEILKEYSEHMGLAFQIADDVLGTFGNEADSGKSNRDDLKEGKITILITRALERANGLQKQKLLDALGNESLTQEGYEECKQIIEDTGALDYSVRLADKHAQQAVAVLEHAPASWEEEGVGFLRDLSTLITHRSA